MTKLTQRAAVIRTLRHRLNQALLDPLGGGIRPSDRRIRTDSDNS